MAEPSGVYNYIRWVIGGVATVFGFVFTWLLHLERRPRGMTREEHDVICERRDKAVAALIGEVKNHLAEQDKEARVHREALALTMGSLTADVSALKTHRERA